MAHYEDVIAGPDFKEYREILEEHWFSYLLIVPTLFFLLFLLWVPFFRGFWMSFHEWPFTGDPTWVGLGNYEYLFSWDPFYTSIKATLIYSLATFIQVGIAIPAALVVKNITRFKSFVSGAFLLPYTMPPVVTGTIWLFLLLPSIGPIWTILMDWGLIENTVYWSVDGTQALTVVTLAAGWTFWPFMFIFILASLQNIPDEHYESAKIYGASRWQQLRYVTLPQIKSTIVIVVILRMVLNLSKVSQPIQLTGGGPGYETSILAVMLYRFAFNSGQMGLSYAVGVVLFALALLLIAVFLREFSREQGERA